MKEKSQFEIWKQVIYPFLRAAIRHFESGEGPGHEIGPGINYRSSQNFLKLRVHGKINLKTQRYFNLQKHAFYVRTENLNDA